jgi:hypothetical protein
MSLFLLIGTIISSSQAKTLLWKSSVNGLLQSLREDDRKYLGSLERISVINKFAGVIEVSLEKEEEGWKLLRNV